jgi:hypothetical protein
MDFLIAFEMRSKSTVPIGSGPCQSIFRCMVSAPLASSPNKILEIWQQEGNRNIEIKGEKIVLEINACNIVTFPFSLLSFSDSKINGNDYTITYFS